MNILAISNLDYRAKMFSLYRSWSYHYCEDLTPYLLQRYKSICKLEPHWLLSCQLELQQSFHKFALISSKQLSITVCRDFCIDANFRLEHLYYHLF